MFNINLVAPGSTTLVWGLCKHTDSSLYLTSAPVSCSWSGLQICSVTLRLALTCARLLWLLRKAKQASAQAPSQSASRTRAIGVGRWGEGEGGG